MKSTHLRRCPRPSSLQRTGLYASLLGPWVALHLDAFDQPALLRESDFLFLQHAGLVRE